MAVSQSQSSDSDLFVRRGVPTAFSSVSKSGNGGVKNMTLHTNSGSNPQSVSGNYNRLYMLQVL